RECALEQHVQVRLRRERWANAGRENLHGNASALGCLAAPFSWSGDRGDLDEADAGEWSHADGKRTPRVSAERRVPRATDRDHRALQSEPEQGPCRLVALCSARPRQRGGATD